MSRRKLGTDVLQAGYDRLHLLYEKGHRLIICFSGGKDSTVLLELAIMAAEATNRLPVEVIIQDEEISLPGLYEFVEETAERPEVKMHWLVMQQPMVNVFNRAEPYWWVMDPLLSPADWVRQPPPYAEFTEDRAIELMTVPQRFPVEFVPKGPKEGAWDWDREEQCLVNVMGLRVEESVKRLLGLHATGGFMTGANSMGAFQSRPIYDWKDGDVWKFIHENKLRYCPAYDTLFKMGVRKLRIGPPTMNIHGLGSLQLAAKAWPKWFDRVCARVDGIRTAVQFGKRAVQPYRRHGETWERCFKRECLGASTPDWVRQRAQIVMDGVLSVHSKHSTKPFPESEDCQLCRILGSWRTMANRMWGGDPYCLYTSGMLEMCEPEDFRPGAGTWAGKWEQVLGRKVKVMF